MVRDGNTIVVTPYGDPFTVRLASLRPPQLRQGSSGLAAKAALEGLLQPGAWVTLSTRSKATEGTELAEIIPVGSTVPINLSLVQVALAALDHQAASPCNQQIYREAELESPSHATGTLEAIAGHPIAAAQTSASTFSSSSTLITRPASSKPSIWSKLR